MPNKKWPKVDSPSVKDAKKAKEDPSGSSSSGRSLRPRPEKNQMSIAVKKTRRQ